MVVQFLTGLAGAASLFLVAAGLSIIFGVTRIVNFAHGSLYMLGAYIAYSLTERLAVGTIYGFWVSVVLAALAVALIGAAIEIAILRRIYRAPELFQLLATFGVVLVVQDAALWIWGPVDLMGPRAPGLDSSVEIMGQRLPEYDLALIVISPLVLGLLWLLFYRTRWGILVRAATQDREMVGALGRNQAWLFTSVFFVGAFLAGLGGAIQLPKGGADLLIDLNIIAAAFVIVVVGGMGSITGAFLAAILIGELQAFAVLLLPESTLVIMFLAMAVVLVVRPWGLLGRPVAEHAAGRAAEPLLRPPGRTQRMIWGAVIACLLTLPLIAEDFTLTLSIEIMILALFAASLHFIMGPGGMVSFGHAAYFGLGAYGAALLATKLDTPMELALLAAPAIAGAGALVFGWFCVRLSGVYLAMLTLAFAQIAWSVVFQWYELTGGEDGLLGIRRTPWADSRIVFYYLVLAACGVAIYAMRRMIFAPFGYAVRAGRDSRLRAEAIGIDTRRFEWMAFLIAGAMAGIAGGLYVYSKGSVFPDEMSIPRSVDGLVMVLLGGVQTLSGPLFGAAGFTWLHDAISRLEYWRFILGGTIIGLVLAFPEGLGGIWRQLEDWVRRRRAVARQAKP
ncbi:MAG: ABC transporter permease [Rhodospirillales bacterium]|nr:MAG: ABC transporter permease [Rhodospirillales bacterium]